MNKITCHYLTTLLLSLLIISSASAQNGESKILEAPVCIYIPIHKDQNVRIPAPKNEKLRISPTAEFIVNYPDGIDVDAQNAFAYAVELWSYQIASDVPIEIDFSFSDLGGSILGSAGPTSLRANFSGAPLSNTWYPIALANKLAGFDLDESIADITISFNSTANWYYGTDGNTSSGKYDFVSVVLHELGHGLGFTGTGTSDGTNGSYGLNGLNLAYDEFVVDSNNDRVENFTSPSTDFHDFLTSNDLYIDGTETVSANGGTPARIYAPSTFNAGSSYSHWNESTFNGTTNALMTPQIGSAESIHDIGDITRGLFKDLGWETKPNDEFTAFNLKAIGVSNSRIDLTWADNSDAESGFIILRSTEGTSGFEEIDTVNADILIYNDLTVESGTTYYYKIATLDINETYESDVVSSRACSNSLPTEGTWTGVGSTNAFGSTISSSNSSITISYLGDDQYLFSDITGGLYTQLGNFDENQSYTVFADCDYSIGSFVDAQFTIITSEANGFGPGSYNEDNETLTLPWYDSVNDFGATTIFTRNGVVSPSISATQITFDNIAARSLDLSWTSGNGSNRIVLARESEPIDTDELPENGVNYSSNSDFSSASQTIGECKVVYNGTGDSFTLTGLTENTTYFLYVLEYNNDTNEFDYLTTYVAANSQTTLDAIVWDGSAGDGNWNNTANWQEGSIPSSSDYVVITNQGAAPVISTDVAVNNLEISSGASITVSSGASLAIFGSVFNQGTYTVERNTTGNQGYSIIGSPITEKTISELGASHFYSNDGTDFSSNLSNSSNSMTPGQGYFAAFDDSAPSLSFTGTPNSGDITFAATEGEFELVANPYAAAINIDEFLDNNSSVISGVVYFWDDGGTNVGTKRGGDYITTNGLGTVGISQPDDTDDGVSGGQGTDAAENGYIPSVQGIFVEAISNGDIVFSQDLQVTTTDANSDDNFYRQQNQEPVIIKLSLSNDELYNELIVGLTSDATEDRDLHLDAKKLEGSYPMAFYSFIGSEKYAIQGLPLISSGSSSTHLGMDLTDAGTYQLAVENMQEIPDDMNILLRDLSTNFYYDLSTSQVIDFQSEAGSDIDRFELSFTYLEVLSSESLSELQALGLADGLLIHYPVDGQHDISIHSIDGKLLFQDDITFKNGQCIIYPGVKQNQTYVLRLDDKTLKFMIK